MYGRRFVWHGRHVIRICTEIILMAMLLGILALFPPTRAYAGESEGTYENETAFRIKPLQEKLAELKDEEIENLLDSHGDMQSHWSRKEVGMLSLLGIINGYNGMFHPDEPVQVDQFLKMTVRSMGFAPVRTRNTGLRIILTQHFSKS